jgi:hypothetical protein
MAYVDIRHAQAQKLFMSMRRHLNYINLDPAGSESYKVKSAKSPKYMGSNRISFRSKNQDQLLLVSRKVVHILLI